MIGGACLEDEEVDRRRCTRVEEDRGLGTRRRGGGPKVRGQASGSGRRKRGGGPVLFVAPTNPDYGG
jgi:hypothetical protein